MKVAYNACFGGFGLSPKATILYAERKGIKLYPYSCSRGITYFREDDVTDVKGFVDFLTEDLGEEVPHAVFCKSEYFYYQSFRESDDIRADPDLIAVIEELGEDKASGRFASITIIDLPDGSAFEIDRYDGKERVVPVRGDW